MHEILRCTDLKYAYLEKFTALDGVSLSIGHGETVHGRIASRSQVSARTLSLALDALTEQIARHNGDDRAPKPELRPAGDLAHMRPVGGRGVFRVSRSHRSRQIGGNPLVPIRVTFLDARGSGGG